MEKEIIKFYYPHGLYVASTKTMNTFLKVKSLEEKSYVLEDLWEKLYEVPYESSDYVPVLYSLDSLSVRLRTRGGHYFCPLDVLIKHISDYSGAIIDGDDVWFRELLLRYFNNKLLVPFTHEVLLAVYNLLYRLHFDLDHLIERGYAVDATSFSWSPYEFEDNEVVKGFSY